MVYKTSFIVIARNESFAIEKCLASIASMPLKGCEVICVDSDSTDNTLDVMKGYIGKIQNYKIIQCSGYLNAAVARNAGLRYATKEYIYFVDGDVELDMGFIHVALEYLRSGKADMITGMLPEIYYTDSYSQAIRRCADRKNITEEREIVQSCGRFITSRSMVERVGLFDERLDCNEDTDYTLRISRHGKLLAIPVVMGIHHTLEHHERTWRFLNRKLIPICFGGVIHKNLDRPNVLFRLLFSYRGYSAGFIAYSMFFVSLLVTTILSISIGYALMFLLMLMMFDLIWGAIHRKRIVHRFLTHYLYTPLIIIGIFFGTNHKRTIIETRVY